MKRFGLFTALALLMVWATASADILDFTIDSKGTVALGGTMLLISGTLTCDNPPGSLFAYQNVSANVLQISVGGKVVSRATGFGDAQCAGAGIPVPIAFQMNVYGGSPFNNGPASVSATATQFSCDASYNCSSSSMTATQKVILNP